MPIFDDAIDLNDSEAFKVWLAGKPGRHYLNVRSAATAMLHKADCSGVEFKDPGVNLAKHRKVGAEDRGRLLSWARQNEMEVEFCSRCRSGEDDASPRT